MNVIKHVVDNYDALPISTNIDPTDYVFDMIDDYFTPDIQRKRYSDDESSDSWGDDFSEGCTESYTNSNDSYFE